LASVAGRLINESGSCFWVDSNCIYRASVIALCMMALFAKSQVVFNLENVPLQAHSCNILVHNSFMVKRADRNTGPTTETDILVKFELSTWSGAVIVIRPDISRIKKDSTFKNPKKLKPVLCVCLNFNISSLVKELRIFRFI
jgi:RNA polymerase subunit RPABC4/transcription elongation factor Spt4